MNTSSKKANTSPKRVNTLSAKQLTLSVEVRQDASFEHFTDTPNQKCATLLEEGLREQSETLFFISGAKESGKTHMASAAIQMCERMGRSVGYFAMNDLASSEDAHEPLFQALSDFDVVVLENVDRWLSEGDREQSLFNLFNQFKLSGQQLVLTARTSPSNMEVGLPDLKSRLQSGLVLSLSPLTDEEKQGVLKNAARERGLELGDDVSSFIIRRSGRNMGQLFTVLDRLDRASLEEKRRLTVPFVKKVLDW